MIDEKKVRKLKLFLLGVVVVLGIIGVVLFNTYKPKQREALWQTQTTHQQNKTGSSTPQHSTSASSEEQSSTTSESSQSPVEVITQFAQLLTTWDLTKTSIEQRASKLQNVMTDSAYEALNAETNAKTLESQLDIYNKTKQINTTNSTALVSRSYVSSTIFQDTTEKDRYQLEVTYKEKLIYQKEGYTMSAKYALVMDGDKVANAKLISANQITEGED